MMKFAIAALAFSLAIVPVDASAESADDAWFAQSYATAQAAIDATPAVESTDHPGFVPLAAPIRPDLTLPLFFANFVAAGLNAPTVPCFGCVYGSTGFVGNSLGVPAPFNVVAANSYWQYNVSWTNIKYVGTCTVSHAITSGTKVIYSIKTAVKVKVSGSYDWGWVDKPVKYVGTALLTGKVLCGKTTSTVTARLYFQ
jgi:hypothetical protein